MREAGEQGEGEEEAGELGVARGVLGGEGADVGFLFCLGRCRQLPGLALGSAGIGWEGG